MFSDDKQEVIIFSFCETESIIKVLPISGTRVCDISQMCA